MRRKVQRSVEYKKIIRDRLIEMKNESQKSTKEIDAAIFDGKRNFGNYVKEGKSAIKEIDYKLLLKFEKYFDVGIPYLLGITDNRNKRFKNVDDNNIPIENNLYEAELTSELVNPFDYSMYFNYKEKIINFLTAQQNEGLLESLYTLLMRSGEEERSSLTDYLIKQAKVLKRQEYYLIFGECDKDYLNEEIILSLRNRKDDTSIIIAKKIKRINDLLMNLEYSEALPILVATLCRSVHCREYGYSRYLHIRLQRLEKGWKDYPSGLRAFLGKLNEMCVVNVVSVDEAKTTCEKLLSTIPKCYFENEELMMLKKDLNIQ